MTVIVIDVLVKDCFLNKDDIWRSLVILVTSSREVAWCGDAPGQAVPCWPHQHSDEVKQETSLSRNILEVDQDQDLSCHPDTDKRRGLCS